MTEREREILNILRDDPMILQRDLANLLGIERSSVAVHIANLMKKGLIQGKGYILSDSQHIVVIGGSNVDIAGRSSALKVADSAEGQISMSPGGVGRNIAEACGRLGAEVKLLSAVGSDAYGDLILKNTKQAGVDVSRVHIDHGIPTSAYFALLDAQGDMLYGVNDMAAVKAVSAQYLKAHYGLAKHARVIVVDANLTEEAIETISGWKHPCTIADPVSTVKASRLKPLLEGLYGIKPNRYEAQALSGIAVDSTESALAAIDWFHGAGVRHVVLTMGHEGFIASDGETVKHFSQAPVEMVNATGAGDVFIGTWATLTADDMPFFECVKRAALAARLNVTSEATIHEALSIAQIEDDLMEVTLNETVLRHSS